MKCAKCQKEETIKPTKADRPLCKKHFLEQIEKRIRKDLRTRQKLSTKKEYTIKKEETAEYHLTKHFLHNIFNNRLKLKDTNKDPDIKPTNLDIEAEEFLKTYMKNTESNKKTIKPLRKITKKEINAICKILNIKQKTEQKETFLAKLENQYPGTNFSTIKTKEFLEDKKNKKTS